MPITLKDIIRQFEAKVELRPERISFWEALTPAFFGGLIIGILAGVPGLNLLFPLFMAGGYYAVKFIEEEHEKEVDEVDAAKVGMFTGIIGGFTATFITLIIAVFFADAAFAVALAILDKEIAQAVLLLSGLDPTLSLFHLRTRFLANIVLCSAMGAVGGVLYVRSKPV